MWWLVRESVRRAPRRLFLAAVAVAFPVGILSATLLFVDDSIHSMTLRVLGTNQIEMRALASSLAVDMKAVGSQLEQVPDVSGADVFGAADVVVGTPGAPGQVTARLFAVEPSYFERHPWVRADAAPAGGVLLNGALSKTPGFDGATRVSIDLPGDVPPLGLSLPVEGAVDVRQATTWFEIPAGDAQGDLAIVPRALVMDFATFEREILPALRDAYGGDTAVTNPGLSDLPPASLEAHISVDHAAYPTDPGQAALWSTRLRRVLEREVPGEVIVADNALEPLTEAAGDATNAKIIFLLLGIPGACVAAALGLAAAAALAEAHRRDDALLRLRGASDTQLVRFAVGHGLVAAVVGTALGLAVGAASVSAVVGHAAWSNIPASRLVIIVLLAVAAGMITTAARLVPVVRAGRRSAVAVERRQLPGPWRPTWLRARLDLVFLGTGLAILAINVLAGGLELPMADPGRPGPTLALSFYVLLAPIALWLGTTLLVVRGLLAWLARWSRPDRPRPLTSWAPTMVRWLGRRPARVAAAVVLGALSVSFGTEVVVFAATYNSAKQADADYAYGADLRLTPATDPAAPLLDLGPDIVATSPIRLIPARAGSDRKSITAIDPSSYSSTVIAPPQIVQGGGLDALERDPAGVLVAEEIVADFDVAVGDVLPVTVFPDDLDLSRKLDLRVAGVFRAFPPSDPFSELVITTAALPTPAPAPDFYMARAASGRDPDQVAAALRSTNDSAFTVTTIADLVRKEQRTLTALNLEGLGRLETIGAALIAGVGVGVLGAVLVLERRREFAVLRSVGADTRQVLTAPAVEGALALLGSLAIGIPVGVGLSVLAVRVLGLFFALPPPLATIPIGGLAALAALVVSLSCVALGIALSRITRIEVASVLREP